MKSRKKISFALTMCMLIIMLSACGEKGTTNSIGKKDSPIPASEAFAQEGIWFYAEKPVTKDARIDAILVFDAQGNVTHYRTSHSRNDLKFGDLQDLSDEDILNLARDRDKTLFELDMLEWTGKADYGIEECDRMIEGDAGANSEFTATTQEALNANKAMKTRGEQFGYKEPQPHSFQLKIETDGTGNQTAKEALVYPYTSVSLMWQGYSFHSKLTMEEAEAWTPYKDSKWKVNLYPSAGAMTVYDMQFVSLGYLSKKIEGEHPGFVLDTPDTKGVKVD